jgi:thiol-disulfide isomerase/thioredoxin
VHPIGLRYFISTQKQFIMRHWKRIIVTLLTNFTFFPLFAQFKTVDSCGDFTLEINAKNHPTDSIRVMYYDCEASDYDSIKVLSKNKAVITGTVNRATEVILFVDPKQQLRDGPGVIRFILEPGIMSLTFVVDSGRAKNVVINGSSSQRQKESWEQNIAAILAAQDDILYRQLPDIEKLKSTKDSLWAKRRDVQLRDSLSLLHKQKTDQALSFAKNEPGSFVSAYLLNNFRRRIPIDSLTKYYSLLLPSVRQSDFGKNLLKEIYTLTNDLSFREKYGDSNFFKNLKNISSLYDVSLTNLQDGKTSLSQYKGKYILLDFWGSWCGPCFKNAPYLEQIRKELQNQPIEFISVSMDQDVVTWKGSVKKHMYPGINLFDDNGILSTYYKVLWAPRYMIIMPDGSVANADAPQPISGELKDLLFRIVAENKSK